MCEQAINETQMYKKSNVPEHFKLEWENEEEAILKPSHPQTRQMMCYYILLKGIHTLLLDSLGELFFSYWIAYIVCRSIPIFSQQKNLFYIDIVRRR